MNYKTLFSKKQFWLFIIWFSFFQSVSSQDIKWMFMNDSITKSGNTTYSGIFGPLLTFEDNSFISAYSIRDSTTINGTNYYNSTLLRCVILDFDSAKNIQSVLNVGKGNSFSIDYMEKDDQNNIYLLCTFRDSLYIDTLPLIKTHGGFDFIIIKYDRKGKLKWIKQMGTSLDDDVANLKVKNQKLIFRIHVLGNLYMGDSLIKLANVKSEEIYIFQINSAGQIDWYKIIQPDLFYRSCEVLGIDILSNGNVIAIAYGRDNFKYLLFDNDTAFNPFSNPQPGDVYNVLCEIDGLTGKFIKEKIMAKGLPIATVEIGKNDDIFIIAYGKSDAYGSKIAPSNYCCYISKFDTNFDLKWINCTYSLNGSNKTNLNRSSLDSYGNLIVTGTSNAKRTYMDKSGIIYEDQPGDTIKYHSMLLVYDNNNGNLKWHLLQKGPKDDWHSMALTNNKGDLLFTGGFEGGPANFKLGNSTVKTNHYYITYIAQLSNNQLLNLPSQLTATAISSSQINLQWLDSTTGEERFVIERSMDGNIWNLHDSVPANTTTYHDTGLTSNTTYYYRIIAVTSFFRSNPSNVAQATTLNTGIGLYYNEYKPLRLFPNPAKDILYIEYEGDVVQAKIIDLLGRTIKQFPLNNYNTTIDIKNFPCGIYYIQVANTIAKFVKTE